jgi:hypothetical protein
MSLSSIERNYYTPREDNRWDAFVDYCEENSLDYREEDFEQFCEELSDRAEDEAADRAMDYAREDRT